MYIYQTMSNNFGFIDIILLAMIAGFIVLRLRNILGRKTGHEAKIPTAFDEKKFENYKPQQQVKPLADTGPEGDEKKDFLKGAEIAYETIITAFANGNKEKLTKLLTSEMKTNFYEAIEQRKRNGITSELTFIGFKNSSIEKFEKIKNEFFATVKFVSEIISVKKDRDNRVIEGNSNKIKIVTDYWKFSKKISSKDPNWFLSEIISK
jgi:predicted lipid-binding transport protein (Tim44 family)